jgi:glycosyltransferase involved in cell wall biosynthesis
MNILMLLIGHDFPPDIRVEKEARALMAAGHHILLICENRRGRTGREDWNGVEIVRLPRLPTALRALNTATLFLSLRSPLWEWKIKQIVRANKPDVLHVHDLPFVGPGLRIARALDLPLVADLHENFAALLKIRQTTHGHNPFDRFIFNSSRFARYERRVLPRCDRVIVVVEEAAQRVKDLGVADPKISIIGNTEDVDASLSIETEAVQLPPSDMILLYVGGFGSHRGLETVIQAMPSIIERIPSALFVIVGDGSGRTSLEQLAQRLDVSQAVRFEGRQPFSRVHSYIEASDVCLVPHVANAHTNATMPHKLFQYMYMAKPVIVSTAIPLARVIRETGAGLIFESGDPHSFASCAFAMQDPAWRRILGEKGRNAVVECYNWRFDAQRLVGLYQSLGIGQNE